MSRSYRVLSAIVCAGALGLVAPRGAAALTWGVPGDGSNTCTVAVPSCDTIAAAVAAASATDTIEVAAGAHAVPSVVVIDKTLTISGAGQGSTLVQPSGGVNAFSIKADDVVIQDLTVENGAAGVVFQNIIADGTQLTRVTLSGQTARGIDVSLSSAFGVSNLQITDSTISGGNIGLRFSSQSQVSGVTIAGTTISGNAYGIYQANDGNSSTFTGLSITGSTFTNNTNYAIYVEELRDAAIEDSTFTGGLTAIGVLKFYASNGQGISNVAIRRNEFSGFTGNALDFEMIGMGLENPLSFEDNVVTKDSSIATAAAAVFVRLHPTLPNAAANLTGNTIEVTGTPVLAATHAIQLRGNGPVVLTGNVLDGGNVGGIGTTPPSSGVFIQSRSGSVIMPATTSITGTCNRITGFTNGVSVFDSFAVAYGGLQLGATVDLEDNTIAGNTNGIVTAAAPPTIDAENNYWGCAAGPGNPGCDTVTGDVDTTPALTTPPACTACNADAQCNDGLACNGVETCDLGNAICLAGTPIVCDDGNECTTDACIDPLGTCGATPVVDGTSCDDGVTCSVPDTCQAGACLGEEDGNSNGTCDVDEVGPLTVTKLTVKGQSGPGANGKVIAKGTFPTNPPADVFDASGPITVRYQDALGADQAITFGLGTCVVKGNPSLPKVLCKSIDRKSKATFKADRKVLNQFQLKVKLGALSFNGPFQGPATITLTYGPGTVRQGSIAACVARGTNDLKCKQ